MAKEKKNHVIPIEQFKLMLDYLIQKRDENTWKFIFHSKYVGIAINNENLNEELSQRSIKTSLYKLFLNQMTNIVTAILENEKDIAIKWFVNNYEESEESIKYKFSLIEEKLIDDRLKNYKKLFETCVFTYLKNSSWGLEEKYLQPEKCNDKIMLGVLNLTLQQNNPIGSNDSQEQNISLCLTLQDVLALQEDLNILKTKLEKSNIQ